MERLGRAVEAAKAELGEALGKVRGGKLCRAVEAAKAEQGGAIESGEGAPCVCDTLNQPYWPSGYAFILQGPTGLTF